MRGTAMPSVIVAPPVGITPAHAGNSKKGEEEDEVSKDHPRTCGEQPIDGQCF